MSDPFVVVMVVLFVVGNVVNVCFAYFLWKLIKLFLRKIEPMGFGGSIPFTRQPTEDLMRG